MDDGFGQDGWDEPGGYDDVAGNHDPGLPGDDLIFLAMLDEEEQRRNGGRCQTAGGCCGCTLMVAVLLLLAGTMVYAGSLAR
jgi:hypothetical protein